MLGAIAYIAYRRAKRANRVSRRSDPQTDAIMMAFGAILLFWPIAIGYAIYEYTELPDKKKFWLSVNIPGFFLMTLFALGWEVYFLYGFILMLVAMGIAAWAVDDL